MADPDVPEGGPFVTLADWNLQALEMATGHRAQALAAGFSETAAEQMAMAAHATALATMLGALDTARRAVPEPCPEMPMPEPCPELELEEDNHPPFAAVAFVGALMGSMLWAAIAVTLRAVWQVAT